MGCVVDPECIDSFPSQFVTDWINHPQSGLTIYDVPYKPNASFQSKLVVDWRVPFKMFGVTANAGYFQEQFTRYNKPLSDNVVPKIENTEKFFSAHLA